MKKNYPVSPEIEIISTHFPLPGAGFLPINAFVIKAGEPILVDTGMGIESESFMQTLESIVDPADLRWIWLTHDDADHTGSILKVLEAAPEARLVANSLAVLRLSTAFQLPMERVYWINPGESLTAGERVLTAVRPPLFDNPTTVGLYDEKSGTYFSADCFGAIIPSPAQQIDEVDRDVLKQGMISWASADSPWLHMVDPKLFGQALDRIRRLGPGTICSAHLPPASGMVELFLDWLEQVPASAPFVTPNQAALEQMLAKMHGSETA